MNSAARALRAAPRARPLVLFGLLCLVAGCSSPRGRLPEIARIYEQAALDEVRNPVIVIHGILGARLVQRSTGKIVWGAFTSDAVDPEDPAGARAVALPLEPPASALDYDPDSEDVYPTGPLGQLELGILYRVVSVSVYAEIIRALGAGGYTDRVHADPAAPRYADDHYTCFSFFYDWRRDNVESAIRLGRFIGEKRAEIEVNARKKIARLRADGTPEALRDADRIERWLATGYRFDIVAHSMGGLIARYFLRYGARDLPEDGSLPELTWAGAEEIDRLIIVGTPNLGSVEALQNLVEGYRASFFLPFFDPMILGTMPSIYQLLPRVRHGLTVDAFGDPVELDFMDPAVWEVNRWGLMAEPEGAALRWLLPGVADAEVRRERARAYLRWCLARARQFHAALDAVPSAPCPARVDLYAADAERTLHSVRIKPVDGAAGGSVARGRSAPRLVPVFEGSHLHAPGDGTVARYSAVADEREGRSRRMRLVSPVPWTGVTFLSDDHLGLTRNPHFTNNMLFSLLERPLHRPPPGRAPSGRAAPQPSSRPASRRSTGR